MLICLQFENIVMPRAGRVFQLEREGTRTCAAFGAGFGDFGKNSVKSSMMNSARRESFASFWLIKLDDEQLHVLDWKPELITYCRRPSTSAANHFRGRTALSLAHAPATVIPFFIAIQIYEKTFRLLAAALAK
jgi:hypothetical protein